MQQIMINNLVIDIIKKNIKNIYLRIYAASGKIQITAPTKVNEHTLNEFIQSKIFWIQQHLNKQAALPVKPDEEFISGEKHFYLGEAYTLNIIPREKRGKVCLRAPFIDIYVSANTERAQREKLLQHWYRKQLKPVMIRLIDHWQPIIGVKAAEYNIKKMKTKWGTCNTRRKRIWLNLALAKKPLACIEYVIVHELVHLLERGHNKRFYAFMDKFLPDWRRHKKYLNESL